MKFDVVSSNGLAASEPTVVFYFEGNDRAAGAFLWGSRVEKPYGEAKRDGFKAKRGQLWTGSGAKGERYVLVGLGKESEANLDAIREGVARAARRANDLGFLSFALRPPQLDEPAESAQAVAEGVLLALYRFTAFQTGSKDGDKLARVLLVAKDKQETDAYRRGAARGVIFADAVRLARDLVNTPPSSLTPDDFVKVARREVKAPVRIRVFNKAQIGQMKMGALLGVNRGSHRPPFFLHFSYKPRGRTARRIGICGKGITFDSGGLSLKPPKSMETMKMDMAGAASVLALFKAVSKLRPPVELHGFTPLTENMPGGNALKPGDVVRAMNGKTIEVLNTDAEGRLVLADALSYASRIRLDALLDVATLTGACTVALGNSITGIMGTDSALIEEIRSAGKRAGEKVWELPLEREYESHIKSPVADMKNMGRPMQAGTIIGGIFLKEFVKKGLPWAHLDIASTAWTDGDTALARTGATGSIVRTLLRHVESFR